MFAYLFVYLFILNLYFMPRMIKIYTVFINKVIGFTFLVQLLSFLWIFSLDFDLLYNIWFGSLIL